MKNENLDFILESELISNQLAFLTFDLKIRQIQTKIVENRQKNSQLCKKVGQKVEILTYRDICEQH